MNDDEEFDPDFAAIAESLGESPLYLDPSVSDAIADEDLAELIGELEGREDPVFVVAIPLTISSDWSQAQVASIVRRESGESGTYLVTRENYDGTWEVEPVAAGVAEDRDLWYAASAARRIHPADLGEQLLETLELYDSGEAEAAWNEQMESSGIRQQPDDGTDGGLLPIDGWIVGALGMAAVIAALAVWRQRTKEKKRLALSKRTVSRISNAQTTSWRRRAETALAQLGERIGQHEITDESDREAWTAALDHYDVASEVLRRGEAAADSVGAFIVAERGIEALEAAVAHRTWEPTRQCFFNPLHGPSATQVDWRTDAGTVSVPACAACAKDVTQHRREPDFLNLPYHDTVVHYVDAEAEPWSSTGYGSLEPDLVSAWRTAAGR